MSFKLPPMCLSCKHFAYEADTDVCVAYPRGIPIQIWDSDVDHRQAYQGDDGVRFAQDADKPEPVFDFLFPMTKLVQARWPAGHPLGGQWKDEAATGPDVPKGPFRRVQTADEAIAALKKGEYVELPPDQVGTLLDKMAQEARDAEARGEKATPIDLCKVSVPNTNLFCKESRGVSRVDMPQLDDRPAFKRYLEGAGLQFTDTAVRAEQLKATQGEIDGTKVGGMMRAAREGKLDLQADSIFVSSDNFVVDGHHRWAATVGIDYMTNFKTDIKVNVTRINMPISALLPLANQYAEMIGAKGRALGKASRRLRQMVRIFSSESFAKHPGHGDQKVHTPHKTQTTTSADFEEAAGQYTDFISSARAIRKGADAMLFGTPEEIARVHPDVRHEASALINEAIKHKTTEPLYRGMAIEGDASTLFQSEYVPGAKIDIGIASASKSDQVGRNFAMTTSRIDSKTPVMIVFEPGASAADVSKHSRYEGEHEHVVHGRYKVKSRRIETFTDTAGGKKIETEGVVVHVAVEDGDLLHDAASTQIPWDGRSFAEMRSPEVTKHPGHGDQKVHDPKRRGNPTLARLNDVYKRQARESDIEYGMIFDADGNRVAIGKGRKPTAAERARGMGGLCVYTKEAALQSRGGYSIHSHPGDRNDIPPGLSDMMIDAQFRRRESHVVTTSRTYIVRPKDGDPKNWDAPRLQSSYNRITPRVVAEMRKDVGHTPKEKAEAETRAHKEIWKRVQADTDGMFTMEEVLHDD